MNGRNQSVKRGSIYLAKITGDTRRGISGEITCSKLISCAILFTGVWIAYRLIIVMHFTSIHCVRLQFRDRENACFYFGHKLWWNMPHCWLCFVPNLVVGLKWYFITSAVSTEKYNVNSIMCQCAMVAIANGRIKLPIALHVMVNIEVKKMNTWN